MILAKSSIKQYFILLCFIFVTIFLCLHSSSKQESREDDKVLNCMTWQNEYSTVKANESVLFQRSESIIQDDSEQHEHRLKMWRKVGSL